jgi:hypothetical protein
MSNDFGLWDVIVSMFWFMLLFAWIWLIIAILSDIFRDRELKGGAKALWTLLLIFLPWLGALLYLIFRGDSMNERSAQAARDKDAQMRAYVQQTAGTTSVADEIQKLADLRDSGAITAADFEQGKAKLLA